jgi:hypothetical protein
MPRNSLIIFNFSNEVTLTFIIILFLLINKNNDK